MLFDSSKNVEWADISVNFEGATLGTKLRGIRFGVKTSKEHLFAEGDDPVGIQSGNREPTGELKVLKGALDVINDAAIAATGRDITDLEVAIVVFYKPAGTRPPRTRTLVGCQFTEWMEGMNQGDKMDEVTLPFLFLEVI